MVVLRCRDNRHHLRLSPLPLCAVLLLIYVWILFELCHDSRVLLLHTQIYDLLFLIYLFLVVSLWFHTQIWGTTNIFLSKYVVRRKCMIPI